MPFIYIETFDLLNITSESTISSHLIAVTHMWVDSGIVF